MPTVKLQLPRLHRAQQKIKSERKRFNVIDCGRRFGKNILLQDGALTTAIAGYPVGWGAPTYKMLLDDWKTLSDVLTPVTVRRNEQEKQLAVVNGGSIDFWSLDNADSIRGRKYKRFIVNEAAFVPNLMDIFNLVIRPTLIDYVGEADFAGTPKGMNSFWQLYNQMGAEWQRWQMSSYENPHIERSELDSLRATMLERAFMQEIMAEFLEDGGGVFRNVAAACVLARAEPVKGRQYVIGADWGRSNDATVFSVIDAETKGQVALDRMTDTNYASQRLRLAELSRRYNRAMVIAETNSMGQPNIEALQNMDVPVNGFTTTNATKAKAIQALELAFERNEIKLLVDQTQTAELMAYQSEKLPSGLIRYGAPEGMHDDTVMALALAWQGVATGTMTVQENPFYS